MSADVDDYDEFGMLGDNAAEAGLTLSTFPSVRRMSFTLAGGQTVSALAWGDPRSAVERGVRHNARRLPDGRWTWRYDLFGERPAAVADHTGLWADVSAITVPVLLVLGADSQFTGKDDVAEFRRRLPAARVEVVPGAGHAIQSDQPLALARLIGDFLF